MRRARNIPAVFIGAAILAIGAGALTACGSSSTYNSAALEQTIKSKLQQHRGFAVQGVHCPDNAKLQKGVVIYCSATLVDGHTIAVRNTELDNKGTVHIVINEEFPDNVERGVVSSLARRGVSATAVCPGRVPIVIGKQFTCALALSNGRHGQAIVTIVDGDGGFRVRTR